MNVLFPAFFMIAISSLLIWSMHARASNRSKGKVVCVRFFYQGSYCEVTARIFRVMCFVLVQMAIVPENIAAQSPNIKLDVFAKSKKIIKLPGVLDNFFGIGIAKKSTPLSLEIRFQNRIIKRRIG